MFAGGWELYRLQTYTTRFLRWIGTKQILRNISLRQVRIIDGIDRGLLDL